MNRDDIKKLESRLTADLNKIDAKIESIRQHGDGLDFSNGMAHLQNLMINRNKALMGDIVIPEVI